MLEGKIRNPQTLRKVILEGHRFTPKEALEQGIVDHIVEGNTEDVLKAAQTLAAKVESLAKTGAWGVNKVGTSGSKWRTLLWWAQTDMVVGGVTAGVAQGDHRAHWKGRADRGCASGLRCGQGALVSLTAEIIQICRVPDFWLHSIQACWIREARSWLGQPGDDL